MKRQTYITAERAGLINIRTLAGSLGLYPERISRWIEAGKLPAPTHTLPGGVRPHYTVAEAAAVRKKIRRWGVE